MSFWRGICRPLRLRHLYGGLADGSEECGSRGDNIAWRQSQDTAAA